MVINNVFDAFTLSVIIFANKNLKCHSKSPFVHKWKKAKNASLFLFFLRTKQQAWRIYAAPAAIYKEGVPELISFCSL